MLATYFQSAVDLARSIRSRGLRSRDLLETYLERIDRHDRALNAVVVQDREGARQRADEADAALQRGELWGPLHGVPITVKEAFEWAGFPTTWGIPLFKDNRARQDAVAVARLKQAGAIVVGKTNLSTGLSDFQSSNDVYGTTNNPWDVRRGPGGSSGGSAAALAAGLTALELGSDIAGSIRNPAHFCGVFGHKPTGGLLPTRGHTLGQLRPADMGVVGPMARSARDLELVVRLLARPDELEAAGLQFQLAPLSKPCSSLRVAVWNDDPICPVDGDVQAGVDRVARALRDAGADVDHEARPQIDSASSYALFRDLLSAAFSSGVPDATFAELEQKLAGLDPADESRRVRALRGTTLRHRAFIQLDEARTRLRWAWHRFFERHDFVLMPVMPTPAFPHDHSPFAKRTLLVDGRPIPYDDAMFWAGLPTVAYLPATVIPAGLGAHGLPVGVQIVGPAYADLKTIELAMLLESRGFAFTPPPAYP